MKFQHSDKRIKPQTTVCLKVNKFIRKLLFKYLYRKCELKVPSGNRCPTDQSSNHDTATGCRNNTSIDWNNSSQVGMNYGEFQRRQLLLQKIQQQQYQQQQARQQNQANLSWLEDEDPIEFVSYRNPKSLSLCNF